MDLLWFLLIGLVAGWLAGKIMKGSGYGIIGDLVLGIVGAFVGGHEGEQGGGNDAGTPQRVPATEVLHVEVSFRGATFLGARGTEQTTPTQGDKTPSSASWSLFPY